MGSPWRSSVLTSIDPRRIEELVAALSDNEQAQSPAGFPSDSHVAARPGLYSWWGDATAQTAIEEQLGIVIPPLVYAGQAGATRWPSGTRSEATLGSRIRDNHINWNASSSTFRHTLSALLLRPLGLTVLKPKRLTSEDRKIVSGWIKDHLRVLIVPYDDRDSLEHVEDCVLDTLDPPLNLKGRPTTGPRSHLKDLRSQITKPG